MNSSELSERIEQALARLWLNPPGRKQVAGWYRSQTAQGLVKSLERGEARLRFDEEVPVDQGLAIVKLITHACAAVYARHRAWPRVYAYGHGIVWLRWTRYEKISVDKSWLRN